MPRRAKKSLLRNQAGQLLVMWLIFMLPMVVVCFSVYNVGVAVSEKMKVQTAADNAAYSAATWNARYMNLTAYTNRAMVANYDTIASFTAIWSFVDATDGFIANLRTILTFFFGVGRALEPAAQGLHKGNQAMSEVLGAGKKDGRFRVGRFLEEYTRVLSLAQQGLYIANQLGRFRVAQTVAWGVDPKIQYWSLSEAWGLQEMGNRRDWKESDPEKGLRLTLERSLNSLSNGGSFRDLGNFPVIGLIQKVLDIIPCLKISIGPRGFDGPGFDHVTGAVGGKGQVRIADKEKIYQNDFNGISIKWDCLISFTIIAVGHNSDDNRNLPNSLGSGIDLSFPHVIDEEGDHGSDTFQGKGGSGFIKKNVDCEAASGPSPQDSFKQDPKFQQTLEASQLCGTSKDPFQVVDVKGNNDGLPPGPAKFDLGGGIVVDLSEANKRRELENLERQGQDPPGTPIPASALLDDRTCDSIQKELKDRQEKMQSDLKKNFKASKKPCQTIYEYRYPLAEMKVTQFVQKDDILDGKKLEGPSVFVFLRKKGDQLPLFRGLGLIFGPSPGNFFNIEAYSFGRAYYTQRPGGSPGDKETLFNPFWAGRLEKAPDNPIFLH